MNTLINEAILLYLFSSVFHSFKSFQKLFQEMTWMIMNGVKLEETKKDLFERSPFIDMPMIRNYSKTEVEKFFDEDLEALPSPRLIKTHYPFELLPPNLLDTCKVI